MTIDPTTQTLAQIQATSADAVVSRFAEVCGRFDEQAAVHARDPESWPVFVVKWTGRKSGILTLITDNWLKPASPELKRVVGQELNKLKAHVEQVLVERQKTIEAAAEVSAAARDKIDLSLPGIERAIGTRHLIRQTYDELLRIFSAIGFSVVAGPEIEMPYYNFEALNISRASSRARQHGHFLHRRRARRAFAAHAHFADADSHHGKTEAAVRIVVPGKVYRRDNPDATHGYMFHQIEGLAVDTDITFCDFKGTVDYFAREFLGPKTKTRLRPSYFPFTEPSAEVDATCHVCGGSGCRVCKQSGWIELFGAGMVNPAVYGFVGYDPEKYSGFAFGMGVDRLAMMKYGVTEVPLLFQNDVRFLKQFP